MSIYANVDGVNKEIVQIRPMVYGTRRHVYAGFAKVNDEWKEIFDKYPHVTAVIKFTNEPYNSDHPTMGTFSNTTNSVTYSLGGNQSGKIRLKIQFKDKDGNVINGGTRSDSKYVLKVKWNYYTNGDGWGNIQNAYMDDYNPIQYGSSYSLSYDVTTLFNSVPSSSGEGTQIGYLSGYTDGSSSHYARTTIQAIEICRRDTGALVKSIPFSLEKI